MLSETKGVTYDSRGSIVSCVFCRIASRTEKCGAELLYEDSEVAVFIPREPSAPKHFLAIPKAHIKTMRELEASHTPLLNHMREAGLNIMRQNCEANGWLFEESKAVFVFHVSTRVQL